MRRRVRRRVRRQVRRRVRRRRECVSSSESTIFGPKPSRTHTQSRVLHVTFTPQRMRASLDPRGVNRGERRARRDKRRRQRVLQPV